MKKNFLHALAIVTLVIAGCKEEVDTSARYVFKEETITSYLAKHDSYSEYYRLLGEVMVSNISETTVSQLLSARGHYTVFAPTNDAIQEYLDSLPTDEPIAEDSTPLKLDAATFDSALQQELARLNEAQQMLFELRFTQELTVPEIAAIIDIPEGTVKSRLNTLTNYLRLKLKDYE